MSKVYGCFLNSEYYHDRRHWVIRWDDGPTEATMKKAIERQLPDQ
ncbi:hypothetical protein ACFWXO_21980 [Kitasatospora sp. NPDC059088]